tara:strand:+ start:1652 stop:1816 length:165 start_codon:yes stop_codon:yes gene_type:complete
MRNYRRKTLKGGWKYPKTKTHKKTADKKTKINRSAGLVSPRSRRRRRRRRNSRT